MKIHIKTNKTKAFVIVVIAFILQNGFSGCSNKIQNVPPATQYGSINFHFHTFAGNQEDTDSTQVYVNQDGINMRLYFSNIFISNIRLITASGDTISPLKDTVVLKHFDEETYPLGNVPAGNYKTVKFDVGLPATLNHTNPSMYASPEPYSDMNAFWYGNKNLMWSGNTSNGYIFTNIKGYIDTSASGKGIPAQPFSYQIGGDANRVTILMPVQAFTIAANTPYTVHMTIDFGYLLHGLNLKTENTCNFVSNPALASKIAKNITVYPAFGSSAPAMFKYEE